MIFLKNVHICSNNQFCICTLKYGREQVLSKKSYFKTTAIGPSGNQTLDLPLYHPATYRVRLIHSGAFLGHTYMKPVSASEASTYEN